MAKTSERSQRGGHSGISIEDVAAAAGVSTATVSRAVRGLPRVSAATREKILRLADQMGYVASSSASSLATGRTRTVGVLAPYVDRWFFFKAIEGVDQELHANGYSLSLFNLGGQSGNRERLFNTTMVLKQIDALLVLCTALTPEEVADLHRIHVPMVVVGGPVESCPSIGIDDLEAAADATRHLLELGHRRIGLLHGDDDSDLNFEVPRLRVAGFMKVMADAGLALPPEWDIFGNFTVSSGQAAFDELWSKPGPKPTALFCASDEMAIGAVLQARRRGIRVPEDLSIIGIDNHEFSEAMGLTTIAQSPLDQAKLGTRMLLEDLAGTPDSIRSVTAEHHLIVRETTAPPAA